MKRVLVLSHMYPSPADPANGSFVHRHVRALVAAGVAVEVVAPVPYVPGVLRWYPRWRSYQTIRTLQLDGISVTYPRYLRPPGRWFHGPAAVSMYLGIRSTVSAIRRRFPFDLIHSHMLVPDGAAAVWLGHDHGVPVVCTARGDDVNIAPKWNVAARRATAVAITGCDQVVAVSQGLAAAMVSLGQSHRPVRVVYTGTDFVPLAADPETSRVQLSLPTERVLLLTVGALYRNKGIFELAAAAARLLGEGIPLHVIYVGSGVHEVGLRQELDRLGIAAHVTLAGQVPHSQVGRYMAAADVVVLPSYNEGLPNVLVEAQCMGRPVVATTVGGIPEVVLDGKSGYLFQARDIDGLVRALRPLILDVGLRQRMGAAGKAFAPTRFNWDQHVCNYLAIYHELLGKG